MAFLIWSPNAVEDLKGIRDYIARNSPVYAQFFIEKIVALIETIPDHPYAGRLSRSMAGKTFENASFGITVLCTA